MKEDYEKTPSGEIYMPGMETLSNRWKVREAKLRDMVVTYSEAMDVWGPNVSREILEILNDFKPTDSK